jgi:hypothetical protein
LIRLLFLSIPIIIAMISDSQLIVSQPIDSVQPKIARRIKQTEYCLCKSTSTYPCYRHYLEKGLAIGFGQLNDVEYEKIEFSKPSIVLLSPMLKIDETQVMKRTEIIMTNIENINEYRKRYAIVHADDVSYMIGGYIFDPLNRVRCTPVHDYKLNVQTARLDTIVPLPSLAVSFGLAFGDYSNKETIEMSLHTIFRWKLYCRCWRPYIDVSRIE